MSTRGVLAALVGTALVLSACGRGSATKPSDPKPTATTATTTPATTGPATTSPAARVVPVEGFERAAFTVTDADGARWPLCLWSAATRQERERGLMFVTDQSLGGIDGMVFEFDAPTLGGFWMRNTPLPLSIAFFDSEGAFLHLDDMAPCGDSDDCPSYGPGGQAYRYAVEVPQGGLPARGIGPGATLRPGGGACDEGGPMLQDRGATTSAPR